MAMGKGEKGQRVVVFSVQRGAEGVGGATWGKSSGAWNKMPSGARAICPPPFHVIQLIPV